MTNWKKAGLTALAGSLVATSAFAGSMSVSGTANLTYTANTGKNDYDGTSATETMVDGARWGMNQSIGFSGSGEMDNGWTVSVSQTLANGGSTGIGLTIDMGDAGSINYESDTGARGVGKIDDVMPTANEEIWNGIDSNGATSGGGVSGKASGGTLGFHYANTSIDMVTIGVGYQPKGQGDNAQGGVDGAGAGASAVSGYVTIAPMDGLEIGAGVGEKATAAGSQNTDDHSTIYAKYTYGPVTVGYQTSNVDTYGTTTDDESTTYSILFAVNDNMSISYGEWTNEDNTAVDEEITGVNASYTMGSMSFVFQASEGDNLGNSTGVESEHTEIGVSFAF
jgi:outer membrane protein OmpU